MKPNQKQLKAIQAIKDLAEVWKTTNDIDSPSHMTLVEDYVYRHLEGYDEEFEHRIHEVLDYIRKMKEE